MVDTACGGHGVSRSVRFWTTGVVHLHDRCRKTGVVSVVATCPPLWVSPSLGLDSPYLRTLKLGHLVEPSMALNQSFLSIRVHAPCCGPVAVLGRERELVGVRYLGRTDIVIVLS